MSHPRAHAPNDLHDFSPEPSLRACVALIRWNGTDLEIATIATGQLPSANPTANESLDQTAIRVIREATGVDAQYLEQLYTFSPSHGGPRQIVISYLGLFSPDTATFHAADELGWSFAETTTLDDDLEQMVLEYALVRLRAKLGYTNIAFYLLPATFTLSELQQTYERILNQAMDKRNFRRRMIASGILIDTGEKRREGSHRPAALYRFREQDDQAAYLTPPLLAQ